MDAETPDPTPPGDAGEWADALTALMRRGGGRPQLGPGWYGIICRLDADLAKLAPLYEIRQVKEKFGGLRFYVGGVPETVAEQFRARIRAAETESERTCELCGAPGRVRDEFLWTRTMCQQHRDQRAAEAAAEARRYQARTVWPPIHSGFGAGWARILRDLEKACRQLDPELYVLQVSETEGHLDVSYWPSDPALTEAVQAAVDAAVAAAEAVCIRCGEPGEMTDVGGGGWTDNRVVCAPCAEFMRRDRRLLPASGADTAQIANVAGGMPEALLLVPSEDGTLVAADYPETEQVVAEERDGVLVWVPAGEATAPVGGPVPAGWCRGRGIRPRRDVAAQRQAADRAARVRAHDRAAAAAHRGPVQRRLRGQPPRSRWRYQDEDRGGATLLPPTGNRQGPGSRCATAWGQFMRSGWRFAVTARLVTSLLNVSLGSASQRSTVTEFCHRLSLSPL